MIIEFGEWLPDIPPLNNPGFSTATLNSLRAINCIPRPGGYQPFPGFAPSTGALDDRCRGAYAVRSSDGLTHTIAGDATKLYRLNQGNWDDISKAGGYSSINGWRGCQWRDELYMTNRTDPIQVLKMDVLPYRFDDLAGTPPQASHIDVVRDFLVTANCIDADGDNPLRVRWSAFNNPEEWVPGQNQSDFQDLRSDGWITGFRGGDYGVVWQERAITRVDYSGPPTVFDFTRVEREKGTNVGNSIIQFGNMFAYLGRDGFYVFDGARSTPIGDGKIDKSFWRDVDQANIQRMSAAVDKVNQLLLWPYPGPGNQNGTPNRMLVYNHSQAPSKTRWSLVDIEIEQLAEFLSESYTLEGLDAVSSSIEGLPFSLDSRFWAGGNLLTVGFDKSNRAGGFTGLPFTAFLETTEFSPMDGRRAHIGKLRPVVDSLPGEIITQIGHRNRSVDPIEWGREAALSATGEASVRASGRYFRARVQAEGYFDHALGIEPLEIVDDGGR